VRDGTDANADVVDLGDVPEFLDAEIVEIGVIGRDRERLGQLGDAALFDVKRLQAAGLVVGADEKHGGRAALGLFPAGKSDDEVFCTRDAGRRKRGILLMSDEERGIVEALGAERYDPEIALRVVEHGGDHRLGADVEPALHRDEHDREDDTGERHNEAQAIVEQVAVGELARHAHDLGFALGVFGRQEGTWVGRLYLHHGSVPRSLATISRVQSWRSRARRRRDRESVMDLQGRQPEPFFAQAGLTRKAQKASCPRSERTACNQGAWPC
jgi:hypothetical protein